MSLPCYFEKEDERCFPWRDTKEKKFVWVDWDTAVEYIELIEYSIVVSYHLVLHIEWVSLLTSLYLEVRI